MHCVKFLKHDYDTENMSFRVASLNAGKKKNAQENAKLLNLGCHTEITKAQSLITNKSLLNPAQTNIIITDGIAFSPGPVWTKADSKGVVSNLRCFYIDQYAYLPIPLQNFYP